MLDLQSMCYLTPEQARFILLLVRWVRRVLSVDRCLSPDQLIKVNAILDVLDGWLPFDAGSGILRIEIFKFGRMEVRVEPGSMKVRFWPWHPLASAVRPCDVFYIMGSSAWLADFTVQECVHRLLVRADARPGPRFQRDGRMEVKWQWRTLSGPSPNPKWVALRELARKQGGQPPRAIHWLRDANIPSSPTPSTTAKQVNHG